MDRVSNTSPDDATSPPAPPQVQATGGEQEAAPLLNAGQQPATEHPLLSLTPKQEPGTQAFSLRIWLAFSSLTNQQAALTL